MNNAVEWVGFAAACAAGSVARHIVDRKISDRSDGEFPWGIWLVNVTGSLLLGTVAGLALRNDWDEATLTILGTGFCGAYTTFSTFAAQTAGLLRERSGRTAAVYAVSSAAGAVAAAAAGIWLFGR